MGKNSWTTTPVLPLSSLLAFRLTVDHADAENLMRLGVTGSVTAAPSGLVESAICKYYSCGFELANV